MNESMEIHGLKPDMIISLSEIFALGWKVHSTCCGEFSITFYYDDFRVIWYAGTERVGYLYELWEKSR